MKPHGTPEGMRLDPAFRVLESHVEERDGKPVRIITKAEMVEVSLVLLPPREET